MKLKFTLLLVIKLCWAINLYKDEELQFRCGYETCTKSDTDKLNIHFVSHSHDDVGWLKTVDQYYFGGRMNIQVAGVQYIIDSVVDSLLKDSNRRFIQVETAFLWKWWQRQDDERKQAMRNLINEGRLEIIGGGWSMNDEAATHYQSLIDQYTWGFRRLNDTFGECARPKIGWQIDPFGHSREQASIFAQLGFDGMLLNRIDYQDKEQRLQNKTMEFIWEANPSLGQRGNLFTTVLYNHYSAPPGFCFDILCRDEPMIDDTESPDFNIDKKVKAFLEFADKQAIAYQTNNIIITMGGDFNYLNAEMYFTNLDKLISGINKLNGKQYKAFYSTPSCYLKAVNEQNLTWPTKNDDFFPYASDFHSFWTGYFTSRPALKFFERMGNNFLQVVKQLSSLSKTVDSYELQLFREAMGVMQHHDAVSGTEKQHVAEDYARLLHHSVKNGERLASDALRKLMSKNNTNNNKLVLHSCLLFNISSCEYTSANSKFVVTVYNPTSQPLNTYVRVPVQQLQYSVKDFNGKILLNQILPIPEQVQKIPGRLSPATHELVFQAHNISALGYQSFYVSMKFSRSSEVEFNQYNEQFINRQQYKIFVNQHGRVSVETPTDIKYEQSFQYYEGIEGNNRVPINRSSGAYIFRPRHDHAKAMPFTGNSVSVFKGPLVQEIHQVINKWTSQVVRLYNDEEHVEFEWLVGPIPIEDKIGKEVTIKYSSNLKNNDEFYTDSNGRGMLKRKLNYRSTWKLKLNETISGNYYPINSKISIMDQQKNRRLSVLNDRAQGGTSLKEGDIELMIHRRLLHDDAFGVDEALNETAYGQGLVVRGRHILIAGSLLNYNELILLEKEETIRLSLRPWLFISPTTYSFEQWKQHYNMKSRDSVIGKLPKNIRILSLEPWKDQHILLRLEHIFEATDSSKYSVPTTVDFNLLFPDIDVFATEMTLGANQQIDNNVRLEWNAQNNEIPNAGKQSDNTNMRFIRRVIMKPMEIRTFVIRMSPRMKARS
ncbi:lysosomal alpha-mannosidase-like isoform X1 [Phymastichus coffea]|uniref:lysosomal alpha-mannosidase-like isoform X1 n=1 Tax=Phymastichus coffea TaxID=108790 RepID=UPI00273B943C|nr:lysosomal alpha-mannosidase-like isoform X1 [Phymastichus coffea]XP_058798008.1 lysosomal alpha-mannosidase-like isoform X1 [Phymastichus coffea]